MVAKNLILCFFVISLKLCGGIEICGLERVPKCYITQTRCLEELELQLRSWSMSPYAKGYFLKQLNPFLVKEITFVAGDQQYRLVHVYLYGLLESVWQSRYEQSQYYPYLNEFRHNLFLEAEYSVITNLRSNEEYTNERPVRLEFRDVLTLDRSRVETVERCDRTYHMQWHIGDLEVRGGRTKIVEGIPEEQSESGYESSFSMNAAKAVGKVASLAIYRNFQQFLSIVPFNDVFV